MKYDKEILEGSAFSLIGKAKQKSNNIIQNKKLRCHTYEDIKDYIPKHRFFLLFDDYYPYFRIFISGQHVSEQIQNRYDSDYTIFTKSLLPTFKKIDKLLPTLDLNINELSIGVVVYHDNKIVGLYPINILTGMYEINAYAMECFDEIKNKISKISIPNKILKNINVIGNDRLSIYKYNTYQIPTVLKPDMFIMSPSKTITVTENKKVSFINTIINHIVENRNNKK